MADAFVWFLDQHGKVVSMMVMKASEGAHCGEPWSSELTM